MKKLLILVIAIALPVVVGVWSAYMETEVWITMFCLVIPYGYSLFALTYIGLILGSEQAVTSYGTLMTAFCLNVITCVFVVSYTSFTIGSFMGIYCISTYKL